MCRFGRVSGFQMELIDLGLHTEVPGRIDTFLLQLRDKLGLDHIAYAGMNPMAGSVHGFVTYPDAWKLHYAEQDFQSIDPALHLARRSIAPVDWSRFERSEDFKAVFRNASDFGISEQGLTVPVRGPYGDTGLLSVSSDCSADQWKSLTREIIGELQSVAVHIHDAVMRSDHLSRLLRTPQLSTREREILQWIAVGKSQQDVGDILGISHRTVEVHLRSARDKLYSLTTPQAVARGIAFGLIYPI